MADLTGRVCLVTGATRGIGRATAEALAKMGATVLVHGRDSAAVGAVCRAIQSGSATPGGSGVPPRSGAATGVVADFASLADVRRLARDIVDRHDRLDVLVNNAGTITMRRRPTADGFEWQLGINHLAPFLLTNLLLERLEASAPARIVTVASRAHRRGALDFDDLNWERRKYDGLQAYGASKLANILFTGELARRLVDRNVTANCLHPGVVATNIFNHAGFAGRLVGLVARWRMLSPVEGAETSAFLASSPAVGNVSGKYFDKCEAVEPAPAANDAAAARRLWEVSEQLTGIAN